MAVTVILTAPVRPGQSYPAGTSLAGYRAMLQLADKSGQLLTLEAPDLSAPFEFADVPAGQYVAAVARLDSTGQMVALSELPEFTVPDSIEPPAEVIGDAPGAITVSFR